MQEETDITQVPDIDTGDIVINEVSIADDLGNIKDWRNEDIDLNVLADELPKDVDLKAISGKYGREIDEEYLSTDWRSKYNEEISGISDKLKIADDIVNNSDLKQIYELTKNGVGVKDILSSMSINSEDITEDEHIIEQIKVKYPYVKSGDDLARIALEKYGVGDDLDYIKDTNFDKYLDIIKNRDEAVELNKKILNEKKVTLLNTNNNNMFKEEDIVKFKEKIEKYTNSINDFGITDDIKLTYDKEKLGSAVDNVVFSGNINNEDYIVLKNLKDEDVLDAVYFIKNKDAIMKGITDFYNKNIVEGKVNDAYKSINGMYNNATSNVKGGYKSNGIANTPNVTQVEYERNKSGW